MLLTTYDVSCPSGTRRHVKGNEILKDGNHITSRKSKYVPKGGHSHVVPDERSPLKCYGCGKSGLIKDRYPTCNSNTSRRAGIVTNHARLEKVEQTYKEFDEYDAALPEQDSEIAEFEANYFETKVIYQSAIEALNGVAPTVNPTPVGEL
ncbi:hypothetical protein HNY73_023246 [Argiope bruennichi]|uniref:Uncharacterized protein n=1 Tax=Argiope bruennichi TaxID=94029 RepID=A0A8T0E507_ARGBR|nr:hypothetical protein HNY73_023246 [Argiope bruennichi]